MSAGEVHLIVPGPLDQRTGGYLYDARMVAGLERLGWSVVVHSLEGSFPDGDSLAQASLSGTLTRIPDGERVLMDGLGIGALPGTLREHAGRLRLVGLVHHPLADETGLDEAERARLAALEREALSACAGVIVTSLFTCERLLEYGVPRACLRAVPPGTSPARPAVGPGAGQPPRLLCVGTVIPRKGHDILAEALSRLRSMPWSCICAGSLDRAPEYARAVLAQVRADGLDDRIEFVGECGEPVLDDLYHHASLFVLPSHYEGYGMAYAEALVRGLPVIGTTGGAVPHTVPGTASILVPPGDAAALADAIGHLVAGTAGAARRATLASAARRHALELPGWDRAAGLFARALVELAPGS